MRGGRHKPPSTFTREKRDRLIALGQDEGRGWRQCPRCWEPYRIEDTNPPDRCPFCGYAAKEPTP